MKVGFIVECGPEGPETKVIPHLAKQVRPEVEPDVVPLDNKSKLKRECGAAAKTLLDRKCKRVLILWDLLPAWGEYEGKGCLHDDCEEIRASLRAAGIAAKDPRVGLVCIHKMLESWIIADERAVKAFLSTPAHKAKVNRVKEPEEVRDPKSALNTIFKKSGSRFQRYVDRDHAIVIAKGLPDLNRLESLDSFARFRDKLLAK